MKYLTLLTFLLALVACGSAEEPIREIGNGCVVVEESTFMADFPNWPRTDEAYGEMLGSYKAGPDNSWFENPPGAEDADFEMVFKDAANLNEDALTEWFRLGMGLDGCYAEGHGYYTFGLLLHVGELHFYHVLCKQKPVTINSVYRYLHFETDPSECGDWGEQQQEKYRKLFDYMESNWLCSTIADAIIDESQLETPRSPLVDVVVRPVHGSNSLYVARCDWNPRWWGFYGILSYKNGHLNWLHKSSDTDTIVEQSVFSARGFIHPDFKNPLVEVFGITHMGNGSYYLFEFVDGKPELLLKTKGLDCHTGDWVTIEGCSLTPTYIDLNEDGHFDIVLTGKIDEGISYDDKVASFTIQYEYRESYIWNDTTRHFESSD